MEVEISFTHVTLRGHRVINHVNVGVLSKVGGLELGRSLVCAIWRLLILDIMIVRSCHVGTLFLSTGWWYPLRLSSFLVSRLPSGIRPRRTMLLFGASSLVMYLGLLLLLLLDPHLFLRIDLVLLLHLKL